MKSFQGLNKRHSYFEGWYLKHQNEEDTVIFIPSYHINRFGKRDICLQIITNEFSHKIHFSLSDFRIKKDCFWIKIGNNLFSEKGIKIDIHQEDLIITGQLRYSHLQPLKYNAMGPFFLIPFMQCNHGVLSLTHQLQGELCINGKSLNFNHGIGYIEKDWGGSFPKSYLWTQCNWHDKDDNCVMLSIADIPFMGMSFVGCICIIYYRGKEYRLATYLGVKICILSKREVILQQGNLILQIKLMEKSALQLSAPVNGDMIRSVWECPSCKVNFKLLNKNEILFNVFSEKASYECDWNR